MLLIMHTQVLSFFPYSKVRFVAVNIFPDAFRQGLS